MAQNGGDVNPLARHGGLSYLEIPAVDARRSATFYEQVFGWKTDPRAAGDIRFSDGGGLLIGKWTVGPAVAPEPGFVPFLYVDDVDLALSRVAANGGELVKPAYAEGDIRVARVRDPAGNLVGLWQFASV